MTRFPATPERTRDWLRRVVLTDPARSLFLVRDGAGSLRGHLGYKGFRGPTLELDNFLRGESDRQPALFRLAEAALLDWAFASGAEEAEAFCLADNPSAWRLHQSLGFRLARRQPLRFEPSPEGNQLVFAEQPGEGAPEGLWLHLDRRVYLEEDI